MRSASRRVGAVLATALTLVVVSGCTPAFTEAPYVFWPPTADRWAAGNSLAYNWVRYTTVPTFNAAQGGNAFILPFIGTIESHTVDLLGSNRPSWMVTTSVTTDWYQPFDDVVVAMLHFEATMNSMGINVLWVSEPNLVNNDPSFYPARERLNDWQMSRPYHLDCGPVGLLGGIAYDQVHLSANGNMMYAKCIEDNFPATP